MLKIQQDGLLRDFYSVGRRQGTLKKLVDDYKFQSQRAVADVLARLLDAALPSDLPADIVVVPVPTVPAHIRQRSFDHAALLARKLARRRHLHYAPLLQRKTNTTQHKLKNSRARQKAAAGAFYLTCKTVPRHVLLVDDIRTTGSTLKSARQLLLASGVKKVTIAVVCAQDEK
jgi:ComF family protein